MHPDFTKEHTKPLFKTNKLLTIRNLYNYHMLIELYKVIKFRVPYSIFSNLTMSDRRIMLLPGKVKLDKRKQIFSAMQP